MRKNNFKVGDKIKITFTDYHNGQLFVNYALVQIVNGESLFIEIEKDGQKSKRWIHFRNCIRLKKSEPIIISIEKHVMEDLLSVPGMALMPVQCARLPSLNDAYSHLCSYYVFKCIKRPKRD